MLKTFSTIEASILFDILSKLESNYFLLSLNTSTLLVIEVSILSNILLKLESNYLLLSSKTFSAIEILLSKSNTKHVIIVRVLLLLKFLIEFISISTLRL